MLWIYKLIVLKTASRCPPSNTYPTKAFNYRLTIYWKLYNIKSTLPRRGTVHYSQTHGLHISAMHNRVFQCLLCSVAIDHVHCNIHRQRIIATTQLLYKRIYCWTSTCNLIMKTEKFMNLRSIRVWALTVYMWDLADAEADLSSWSFHRSVSLGKILARVC